MSSEESSKKRLLVALAGQQNAGKSTLFNVLTGARQHIANYPGVTVDKKYGIYRDEFGEIETVDLPGTYSLTSFSLEERVARDFLIDEQPDLAINVVDSSNLRRSLHLTLQLMELNLPPVLVLNMMDIADGRGLKIDATACSRAETGVGATIAAGSQRWKGISAALPMPNMNNASSTATVPGERSAGRTPPGRKSVVPATCQV